MSAHEDAQIEEPDADDGWSDEEPGWGPDSEDELPTPAALEKKMTSVPMIVISDEKIDIRIKRKVDQIDEKLYLDNFDHVLAVLRFFNWDIRVLEERWFKSADETDKLRRQIGLDFDETLVSKNPGMNASLAANNGGLCPVYFDDFDENDDEMRPMALGCGHQFCAGAWKEHLKASVKDKARDCVFTHCQTSNCNMLVPHQWFLDMLVDEEEFPYRSKYIQWHRRQFTDSNQNVKSCPRIGCEKYIELTKLFSG